MQVQGRDTARFLARPDPAIRIVLLYGPDAGLVAERAEALTRQALAGNDDPFALQRFESEALASDPPRLAEAAHALSLFGGNRVIRIRMAGPRPIQAALDPVLRTPPTDALIVIEAGELRRTAPLRRMCEGARSAAAIPCYSEAGRDLDGLIDEEITAAGLALAPDAREALRQTLGADRMVSRAELRKLVLYAGGDTEIRLDHVAAIVGEASALAVDALVDAIAGGEVDGLVALYRRLLAGGANATVLCGAVLRHFQALHRARASGGGVEAMVPPVFGPRRATAERQLRLWPRAMLERALDRLDAAMLAGRRHGAISADTVGESFLAIAAQAAAARRRN